MPKVAVYSVAGERVAEMDLNEKVFGADVHEPALRDVVTMQLANRRRGTAATKTRGEVRGGGRKPWRQKGTGRARHGSIRSPLWVGGGTVFGPQPRDYSYDVPRKVKRLALRSALSVKVKSDDLIVLENFALADGKTKSLSGLLQKLDVRRKALIVTAAPDKIVDRSARNIPGVTVCAADGLNVYDVLCHDKIVMTRDAVLRVEEVLG